MGKGSKWTKGSIGSATVVDCRELLEVFVGVSENPTSSGGEFTQSAVNEADLRGRETAADAVANV